VTTLYIAGPMTGLKDFNRSAFNDAEKKLRAAGYEVLNPARQPDGLDRREYMRRGVADVLEADGIATLWDWVNSKGAFAEVALAEAVGVKIWGVDAWLTGAEVPF